MMTAEAKTRRGSTLALVTITSRDESGALVEEYRRVRGRGVTARLPQSSEGGNRAQPVALGFVSQPLGFAGITHGAEETDIEEAGPYATRSVYLCTVA
jgi:hypothetical protein